MGNTHTSASPIMCLLDSSEVQYLKTQVYRTTEGHLGQYRVDVNADKAVPDFLRFLCAVLESPTGQWAAEGEAFEAVLQFYEDWIAANPGPTTPVLYETVVVGDLRAADDQRLIQTLANACLETTPTEHGEPLYRPCFHRGMTMLLVQPSTSQTDPGGRDPLRSAWKKLFNNEWVALSFQLIECLCALKATPLTGPMRNQVEQSWLRRACKPHMTWEFIMGELFHIVVAVGGRDEWLWMAEKAAKLLARGETLTQVTEGDILTVKNTGVWQEGQRFVLLLSFGHTAGSVRDNIHRLTEQDVHRLYQTLLRVLLRCHSGGFEDADAVLRNLSLDTVQVVEDASGTAQFKISRIDKVHAHTQTLFAQGADHHIKPQVPLSAYTAFEVWNNPIPGMAGKQADMFSFGAMLYELFTRRSMPSLGEMGESAARQKVESLRRSVSGKTPSMWQHNIQRAILAVLHFDPHERMAVRELMETLGEEVSF